MSERCVLTLELKTEPWQADIIDKRMEICRSIYNALLGKCMKQYHRMIADTEYRKAAAAIKALAEAAEKTQEYKEAVSVMNKLRKQYMLTEYGLGSMTTQLYDYFKEHVPSRVAHLSIAKPAWSAMEKFMFQDGKKVHFKKKGEFRSVVSDGITGVCVTNSNYLPTDELDANDRIFLKYGTNKGRVLFIPVVPPKNDYEREMLKNRIVQVRLLSAPAGNRRLYKVQLVMDGLPVVKRTADGKIKHLSGTGNASIYIDTETVTVYDGKNFHHFSLSDWDFGDCKKTYQDRKVELERKMERSRRAMNPDNYNDNGTIKKGVMKNGQRQPLRWNNSNNYKKLKNKHADVCRKEKETRKLFQERLASEIVEMAGLFIVNDRKFADEAKKKGARIRDNAPAQLIMLINQKSLQKGGQGIIRIQASDIAIPLPGDPKADSSMTNEPDYAGECENYAKALYLYIR